MWLLPTRLTRAGIFRRLSPIATIALLAGCSSGSIFVSPGATGPRIRRVAVLDFDFAPSPDSATLLAFTKTNTAAGQIIADQVSQELGSLGRYQTVERKRLGQILEGKGLQPSDLVAPRGRAPVGPLVDVDAFVLGTVDHCTFRFFTLGWTHTIGFSARLVDTNTGQVLWAVSEATNAFYTFRSDTQIISSLARKMVRKLATELANKEQDRK